MDTLQYFEEVVEKVYDPSVSFKPCYKWIPFNTSTSSDEFSATWKVLNLVINGYPSIHNTLNDLHNKAIKF